MVYVTSDLHGAFDIRKINPRESEVAQKMQAGDYLIVCGDFGCVWDGASNDNFWLNWLESLPGQLCSSTAITKISVFSMPTRRRSGTAEKSTASVQM